ncbi:CPBP family intramembrane glutamic endopeptidase [Glacieibacterium sp.]|uniref:CPBP family intramembrane glutamic endopeptidase n=1 Tax=Glacieibacterium sp. TaxID=2860237 RepID=UPI003AFFB83C
MIDEHPAAGPGLIRGLLGALFLVAAYFAIDQIESAGYALFATAFGLHMVSHGEMGLLPYASLMLVRLALDLLVVAGVIAILGRPWRGFPLMGPRPVPLTFAGLAIRLMVMIATILAIIASGSATVAASAQTATSAAVYGSGWLVFDFIGAAGEELYGRVAILLVAQSLIGWRGAIVVSGLMFSVLHLVNPGVSWLWLLRLFVQGALLAYAVYRTGSIWWSIGYHTGWNWASAPLFGAAGSGYLDQGHLFDFRPTGSLWITGGPIGPEGSVFAFLAVLCAFGLFKATTSSSRLRNSLST